MSVLVVESGRNLVQIRPETWPDSGRQCWELGGNHTLRESPVGWAQVPHPTGALEEVQQVAEAIAVVDSLTPPVVAELKQ